MKSIGVLGVLFVTAPCFSQTLASRLGTPFGLAADEKCAGGTDASTLTAQVGSFDTIIFQWSDMHNLQGAFATRVAGDRANGLKVMLGMSPTKLTGSRTDIDLPDWVANACGLTQNTASFLNPCLQAQFIADATTYAAVMQPEYFHLATEINTLLLRGSVNEFTYFGALYSSAVPAVKGVSPNSKVFVSFQYDLQVRFEQDHPQTWDTLLNAYRGNGPVSDLDFVGYTTYPSSSPFLSGKYATPSDVPSTYYASAAAHLKSPERVVFTEIGWPTRGGASEAAQKTFLDRLPELMNPAHPALVAWALLHDVDPRLLGGNADLASVGVRHCDGTPKAGWATLVGNTTSGPSTSDPLGAIQIFPNPLRPSAGQTAMNFTGLPSGTRLRIYTPAGEKIKAFSANPFGSAAWDGTNQTGQKAASGVYFVLAQGEGDKKTIKVAIQR